MPRIIDLGNGYGRVEGYGSEYASLTFPLTAYEILRLYAMEVVSEAETRDILSKMGYELPTIKWSMAVGKITTEQWKARLDNARTI